jgi:hypothetical protein
VPAAGKALVLVDVEAEQARIRPAELPDDATYRARLDHLSDAEKSFK